MSYSPFQPPQLNKPGDKQHWGKLPGSSQALCLVSAARHSDKLTLVITPDGTTASALESELHCFNSGDGQTDRLPILHFPDWETLPYDTFSPHQDIISQRLSTLYQLPQLKKGILVVPVTTLMHRLLPQAYLAAKSLVLRCGQQFDAEAMRLRLEKSGYHCVDTVYEHGEFAVRGSLMDIFPMGSDHPYRIDLFDDEVDSLRTFDPETQRTVDRVEQIQLLPAKEFPLDKAGISLFKERWHERFDVDHRSCPIYQDISGGISPAGIEYYLPLFFEQCSNLFDYLPSNTQVFTLGRIENGADHFWQELSQRYESRCVDPERPLLPPKEVFLDSGELFSALKQYPRAALSASPEIDSAGHINFDAEEPPALYLQSQADNPLEKLEIFLAAYPGRVLFCAESAGRRETLLELLGRIRVNPDSIESWEAFSRTDTRVAITVAPLDQGLLLKEPAIALIAESQLFGERVQQRRRRKASQDYADQVIKNLTELRIGAPVVHIDHGVGRYRGMQTIAVDSQDNEFLTLEYANEAKLYVPVASLHLISRYSGTEEELAPLHKLGSEQWQKAKRKAAEQVRDVAAELLDIYARRAARVGFQFERSQIGL